MASGSDSTVSDTTIELLHLCCSDTVRSVSASCSLCRTNFMNNRITHRLKTCGMVEGVFIWFYSSGETGAALLWPWCTVRWRDGLTLLSVRSFLSSASLYVVFTVMNKETACFHARRWHVWFAPFRSAAVLCKKDPSGPCCPFLHRAAPTET